MTQTHVQYQTLYTQRNSTRADIHAITEHTKGPSSPRDRPEVYLESLRGVQVLVVRSLCDKRLALWAVLARFAAAVVGHGFSCSDRTKSQGFLHQLVGCALYQRCPRNTIVICRRHVTKSNNGQGYDVRHKRKRDIFGITGYIAQNCEIYEDGTQSRKLQKR